MKDKKNILKLAYIIVAISITVFCITKILFAADNPVVIVDNGTEVEQLSWGWYKITNTVISGVQGYELKTRKRGA